MCIKNDHFQASCTVKWRSIELSWVINHETMHQQGFFVFNMYFHVNCV